MKFAISDKYTPAPAGMMRLPLDTCNIIYYGGLAKVQIEAGQTKDVQIKPANYQTSVTIRMPEDPIKKLQIPPFVLISRNVGLLAWNDGKVHGPEDHRLGRLEKNALYYNAVLDGDVFKIENLPPGSYSVFAGPIFLMSAAKMEVLPGGETAVEIPPVQVTEQAKVGLWTFDRKVNPPRVWRIKLEARDYGVTELCELLTAKTDSNPRIVADPAIENEKLKLTDKETPIWDLMEAIYLAKGWRLVEHADRTLLLRPGL